MITPTVTVGQTGRIKSTAGAEPCDKKNLKMNFLFLLYRIIIDN